MDIRRVAVCDREGLQAWAGVLNTARAHDTPWLHPLTARQAHARVAYGWDLEPEIAVLGTVGATPVAAGSYAVTERDNRHLAWLEVVVAPDHRGRGHGAALLAHLEGRARRIGRTSVGVAAWEEGGTEGFALRYGYRRGLVSVRRRQHLAEIDPGLIDRLRAEAAAHAGDYALARFAGATPEQQLPALAAITAAINDAPIDELDIEQEIFDAARVRDYETAQRESGMLFYRVLARHRGTGALAGHTVVVVDPERPHLAEQHDTAVAPEHRGHRLGLLLKTAMLCWLREEQPGLAEIDTENAASNHPMVAVNERLGYRVMGRQMALQRSL